MPVYYLEPVFKDYLWGGSRLKEELGKKTDLEIVAESWELSALKESPSYIVVDGKRIPFTDFLKNCPEDELGRNVNRNHFPILVKLIDSKDNLSIQVHPNDEYAKKLGMENGKNECWYFISTDDDAFIYYGLKKEVSREELADLINSGEILSVLNKVNVKAGDFCYVPAGTIHAIGKGCLLLEIQQSSDVTYRIFDYNRKDSNNRLRELHKKEAIEVSNLNPDGLYFSNDFTSFETKAFRVEKIRVNNDKKFNSTPESFIVYFTLNGKGLVRGGGINLELEKGRTVFVTAGSEEIEFVGDMELIKISIPSGNNV